MPIKKLPPRKWELDDLLALGKREKGKADYLKAIPVLILEKWIEEGKEVGVANHIRTAPIARRLEETKLVKNPFKPKGTSNILGALGSIQKDRNLTRPPLMDTKREHGGSYVNLPFYEPLLQKYRLFYQENFSTDYKKLFPEVEPNWGEEKNQQTEQTLSIMKFNTKDDDVKLLTAIEEALKEKMRKIERLTAANVILLGQMKALKTKQEQPEFSDNEIIDNELRSDCAQYLERQETFIDAIRRASVVLEERLRKTIGGDGPEKYKSGVDLVDIAFSKGSGRLIISDHPAEQEGVYMLFRGAVQFVRNPPSHKKVQYTRIEATRAIGVIDYLLLLLRLAKHKPNM